jgi:ribosomal protein L19E
VKENEESLILRKKMSEIKKDLRELRERGIIDQDTYSDFFLLVSNAATFDQLDQMADDLAGFWESGKHRGEA